MKNYTYTARDTAGSVKKGTLQAADRTAVFQELRAQGLVPLSVTDGGAASGSSLKNKQTRGVWVGAAIGAALVAGCLLVLMALVFKQKEVAPEAVGQGKAAVKSVVVKKPEQPATSRTNAVARPAPTSTPRAREQAKSPAPEPAAVTNVTAAVIPKPSEPAAAPIETEALPPSGYSSGVERIINMIVNTRKGMPPPPLVKMTPKADIAKILSTDISVYDEDSELTIERKTNVAIAKEMLKEYLQQGGKTEDFLRYYHSQLKEASETRKAAQSKMMEFVKAGDVEGARRYMDAANQELGAQGIVPLTPHPAMSNP